MVLVLAAAICAATLVSASLAIVASALRQRGAHGPEEELATGDGARSAASAGEQAPRETTAKRPARRQALYVGVLLIAALVYYSWSRRGQDNLRSCTAPPSAEQRLKLFSNLRGFHHDITTLSPKAQALFDQGLLLSFDFAQPEAEAAFRHVAAADANASMAHWGIQYSVGPGANRAVLPERPPYPAFAPDNFPTVYQASRDALRLAEAAAAAEPGSKTAARDLTYARAAVLRWPDGSAYGDARDAAEIAYSRALREYGEQNTDGIALALAAEAIMNLHPWDYYTADGEMKQTSKEAEQLINAALDIDASNPLANHLLIHISEASSPSRAAKYSAYRAMPAANRIHFGKGPWNAHLGHLMHMPSHTYIRTGRYYDAVVANINAYNADLYFAQHCMLTYEPEHNTDMLIFTASMCGKMTVAEEFSLKIRDYSSLVFLKKPDIVTINWAKLPLLLVHYARWKEVMQLGKPGPEARANCPKGGAAFTQVVWRYARALAAAARAEGAQISGNDAEFQQLNGYLENYLQLLREAESKVGPEPPVLPPAVYLCEYPGLSQIFVLTAEARVAVLRGEAQVAIEKLQRAVAIEDSFRYMEPPRVYQPVRQCLGYVLARSGRLEEAIEVYKEDLAHFPDNGWSLHGISDALHELGRHDEVKSLRSRVEEAWKHADTSVDSSCLVFSRPWGAPVPNR